MSENIYAKPDLSKKVRFQTGEKEDRNAELSDNADVATIYDNYLAEENTMAKLEEDTTEDRQQAVPVAVSSGKRTFLGVAAVFLGLLCVFLLTAVIVLLVLLIQDKNSWNTERNELLSGCAEIKLLNANLSQTTSLLKAANANLTREREEQEEQFEDYFQQGWVHFNHSFYYISSIKKPWDESREYCLQRGADLVIIDIEEEQNFLERFLNAVWIGLKYNISTEKWKWVDKTTYTKSYWLPDEPNGVNKGEHCVEFKVSDNNKGWNDVECTETKTWICEKKVAL